MKFTPEFIERVAAASNIVDIISQYTQLKPAGGGLMGRCPFPDHPEKTPSFSVSETKQVYHCFGCQKSGNIFSFLEQYNGMSFRDSVEYLAEKAMIPLPVVDLEQSERLDKISLKKKEILRANQFAVQFFHEEFLKLPANHPAAQYAEKRGLSKEIVEKFKIGYADAAWDSLIHHLSSKGISISLMEEAKLIKARATGTGHYDLFRERLMFPIFDTKGDPIAFGGRILGSGDVKYLNSPETLVFSKSKTLYGLSETSKYIRAADQVFVVEGYMDLIALYRAGVQNVVAPMGTALTADQARMLRRQTKNVVVLFDGDDPGINAAEKSLPVLLEAETHPYGLILPDEMDPDEYIEQHGVEEFKRLLQQTPELFSMILHRWMRGYKGDASQKVQITDRLQNIFSSIADSRLRALYFEQVREILDVDAKWLSEQFSSQKSPKTSFENKTASATSETPATTQKIILKGAPTAEMTLMALALKNRANFNQFLESHITEQISHPGVRKVLERAAVIYGQDLEKFDRLVSLLAMYVDLPEKLVAPMLSRRSKLSESTAPGSVAQTTAENAAGDLEQNLDQAQDAQLESRWIQDCIVSIREKSLKTQTQKLALELKSQSPVSGNLDPQRLEQIMNLQRDRLSLRRPKETLKDKKEDDREL